MGKYLRKNKTKKNIPIRAAAVLLYLTLVTTYFVSGLFARYATTGQASDQARVAKFSIRGNDVFSQPIEADFVPGSSEEVKLAVYNNSEVSVEYTVEVDNFTGNLPLTFSMSKTEDNSFNKQGKSITFSVKQLPGSHTDNYTLTIEWPNNGDKAKDLERAGMVDYITVTVTAVQID